MATIAVWDCWSLFKQESPRTPILNTLVPGLGSLPSWIHYPDVWSVSHILSNLPGRWRLLLPSSMSILLLLPYPLSFLLPLPTHSCPAHSWWPSVNLSVPTPPEDRERNLVCRHACTTRVNMFVLERDIKAPPGCWKLRDKRGNSGQSGAYSKLKVGKN